MKDLEQLKETLKTYNGKNLFIRFTGSLRTYINIENAQCLVTKIVMIIGNDNLEDNQELEILTDDLRDITFNENEILLNMNGNYTIEIIR